MIAVQGPAAQKLVMEVARSRFGAHAILSRPTNAAPSGELNVVSRTGYTGEDGFELIVPASAATDLWEKILAAGRRSGRDARRTRRRDTLRLEAAMPLYGHELSESIDPFRPGSILPSIWRPQFPGPRCVGSHRQRSHAKRVRVGLEMAGKRVPREGYAIMRRGARPIGEVTSGTFSPTLKRPIAMGYVQADCRTARHGSWRSTFAADSSRPASCRCRFIRDQSRHRLKRPKPISIHRNPKGRVP